MAKAKTSKRRYHELTTPTTTSRALTWLMLLLVPVIAFFLGMKYQQSNSNLEMLDMKDQMLQEQLDSSTPSAELP
jgi:hypothetical protein